MVMDYDQRNYRDANVECRTQEVKKKKKTYDDIWWDQLDHHFIYFIEPLIDMLRNVYADIPIYIWFMI